MADAFRTPDERFAGLPDFPFEPSYLELDGLRLARVDEGEGAPVVFFHGEPTWSFLWRNVIPPIRDTGFRCIAPDLAGFGRSDKPLDVEWYSYDRHTQLVRSVVEELDLRGATAVVHDWGGPIGLRLAAEAAERFDRLVIMDSGLFTGRQRMADAWIAFRDFVERTEDLPVSMLVRRACKTDPGDEVAARLRRAVPDAGVEGRRPGLPAHPSHLARHARRRGWTANARGPAAGRAPDPDPVGRLGPRAAARDGAALCRRDRPRRAGADRGRVALPPGGRRGADRTADRGLAGRLIDFTRDAEV
jgi:haloalkane dehalogenase